MSVEFDTMILACRQAYVAFQQLAGRTDEALYQALGRLYAIQFDMRADAALQSQFGQVVQVQRTGLKPINETLLLVKYAFFPHTLQPGPGHKADITKASRYGKLIDKASDANIAPADFVAFAREHGIQRTAAGSALLKRCRRYKGPARHPRHWPGAAYIRSLGSFTGAMLHPLESWFYSTELGARLSSLVAEAQQQPQKIRLTVYLDRHRAVFTGCRGKPWTGEFPEAEIRVPTPKAVSCPAEPAHSLPPDPRPTVSRSLPLRRRGISISRIAAR